VQSGLDPSLVLSAVALSDRAEARSGMSVAMVGPQRGSWRAGESDGVLASAGIVEASYRTEDGAAAFRFIVAPQCHTSA